MQGDNQKKPLYLIYFDVRGKLQPIRNLVCFLDLPFVQVHLENEEEKKKLPEEVKQLLRGVKIDKSSLPLLAYDGNLIFQTFPIMTYICRKCNCEVLMGRTIRQRARVNEFLELLGTKEPNMMNEIFKLAEESVQKGIDAINHEKLILFQKLISESGYIAQICDHLAREKQGNTFIFETVTLSDFYFLETCHYMLGIFNSINQKKKCAFQSLIKDIFSCSKKKPQSFKHLKTIQTYVNFIYSQPFYKNHKTFLQSFTIICPMFPPEKVNGLKKIWGYNSNFVK